MPSPKNTQNALKWVEMAKKEADPIRAKHYFEMALELDPQNVKALNGKGIICYRLGEYDGAIACYDSIINKGIKNPSPVYYNKAMALRALHKYEAALTFIKKTLRCDPSSKRALELKNELEMIMERRNKEHSRQVVMGNARKNIAATTYTRWDPPAPSTVLNRGQSSNWNDYKYQKGFGEDLIKEKTIAEKINRRSYCCGVCHYRSKNDVCKHKKMDTKVSPKAICKYFKPEKGF